MASSLTTTTSAFLKWQQHKGLTSGQDARIRMTQQLGNAHQKGNKMLNYFRTYNAAATFANISGVPEVVIYSDFVAGEDAAVFIVPLP